MTNTQIAAQALALTVIDLRKQARKQSYLIGNEPVWEYTEVQPTRFGSWIEITVYSTGTVYMIDEAGVDLFFWNIESAASVLAQVL